MGSIACLSLLGHGRGVIGSGEIRKISLLFINCYKEV